MATLEIDPRQALIDVERKILFAGFPPYALVTVKAEMEICGVSWRSESVFLAGHDGELDLRRDAPIAGYYERPSAMGVVWSMVCTEAQKAVYPPDRTTPLVVLLRAEGGGVAAMADFSMTFAGEGVTHRNIREDIDGTTVSGELFTPGGPGPHPLIVYMNGSGGGVNAPRAALFASRGYQCLALGIFNYASRPRYLNDMPLEHFERALNWARDSLRPRDGFVALSGTSRGAEAALLVASTYPALVSAVVAYVPSAATNGVTSAGAPGTGRDANVWTLSGQPLAHLWQDNAHADWDAAYAKEPPYRLAHAYRTAMSDTQAFARARIPVERFPGPVMLVSASDDGFWPSTAYSEMVVRRRQSAGGLPTLHHVCEGAGHRLLYPYLPTTLNSAKHPMSGLLLDSGGTPAANAVGNEQSYRAVLAFLEQALSVGREGP